MRIFDTDAMTAWLDPRHADHDRLWQQFDRPDAPKRATTVVSLQEQMAGWIARVHRARKPGEVVDRYARLLSTFDGYTTFVVLPFDTAAQAVFEAFRRQKLRVPTMDLRIACIALVHNATLLTRNIRDFRQVPGLTVEDWSR